MSSAIDQTSTKLGRSGGRSRECQSQRHVRRPRTALLQRVELRSASDVVLDQLQALILEGRLRPGERLPAEPELSDALEWAGLPCGKPR